MSRLDTSQVEAGGEIGKISPLAGLFRVFFFFFPPPPPPPPPPQFPGGNLATAAAPDAAAKSVAQAGRSRSRPEPSTAD